MKRDITIGIAASLILAVGIGAVAIATTEGIQDANIPHEYIQNTDTSHQRIQDANAPYQTEPDCKYPPCD